MCLSASVNIIIMPIYFILILLMSHQYYAFNMDLDTALIHRGPPGTYFGFSVSQHKDGRASWLLVGAPLAQTDQPQVEKGGAVYRCSSDSGNACQQIPFDVTGSSKIVMGSKEEQVDEKSYQWFGATVQSSGKTGMILACAPRYVYYTSNRKRRDPVGTCYLSRGSFTGFLEYSPCRTPHGWGYHKQGSCQAGFSAAISRDGKRAYIGAPGSWYWQGQVYSQNLINNPQLINGDKEAPLSTKESPATDDDTYLGYALAIGRFSDADAVDVAIGVPKGDNLTGKVVIMTSNLGIVTHNVSGEQIGSYFGHSLATADVNGDGLDDLIVGAPLFSKPDSKDSSYEQGRIYVIHQNRDHSFVIRSRIDGRRSRARLGSAITSLSDLNKDGFDDIAVGAPYDGEDGRGAVYIFNGGRNGLGTEPTQVIYASQFSDPGLRTFGFSLSGGLDMDRNEYPDMLIGAYNSDRAIHLRGRPVVNVTASLKIDPENVNLEERPCTLSDNSTVPCVIVSMCFQYTGIGVPRDLNFTYSVKLDMGTNRPPRLFLLYNEGRTEDQIILPLKKDEQLCRNMYTYLATKLRDKLNPIRVDVEYGIYDPFPGASRVLKPILNAEHQHKMSKQIHIEKNCGPDNNNMEQYLIGSRSKLELDVTVRNGGEDAFEATFYLFMPLGIDYININKSRTDAAILCKGAEPEKTGINVLICDIGNPLTAGRRVSFSIILEPSSMGITAAPDFTFISNVNSSNPEAETAMENNEVVIGIPIRVEVNMTVKGASNPEIVIYNISDPITSAISNELDIGPQVYHVFQVQNRGPSKIIRAQVTILWPSLTTDNQHLLYLLDQPVISGKTSSGSCQTITLDEVNPLRLPILKNRTTQTYSQRSKRQSPVLEEYLSCGPRVCVKIYCQITNLAKGETVLFTIRSRLWKETIADIMQPQFVISSKIVTIITELPFGVDPAYLVPESSLVTTNVHVVGLEIPRPVPLLIYVLAVIGGLLLLGLLVLCFYKRKRPPVVETDSEPLHSPSGNGYHYRRGDVSL